MYKEPDYEEIPELEEQINEKHTKSILIEIRLGFIRKVLGILSSQLLLTVFLCLLSMSSTAFLEFQLAHSGIFMVCLLGTIVIPCSMICFESTYRKVPTNYIILFIFTLFESYLVSFICGVTNPRIVLMAASMTLAMVIALTLYAITSKSDFSYHGGTFYIFGCAFLMFSLFAMFTSNSIVHIILCILGIVVFGFYLVYDIQLLLGDKSYLYETDDYIIASLMLYTDIIGIFLKVLELFQILFGNKE